MPDIRHQIIIQEPPERVFLALSEPDELRAWWTRDLDAEAKQGSEAEFRFMAGKTVIRMRIVELEEDTRVSWLCLGNPTEWTSTRVTFELWAYNDTQTLIDFGHYSWKNANGALPMVSYDWAHYLRSLKLYLETGEGIPHPEYWSRGRRASDLRDD